MKRLALSLWLLLLMVSCNGAGPHNIPNDGVPLEKVLDNLHALQAPRGLASTTFSKLKETLSTALKSSGQTHFASSVPAGNQGVVSDLALTMQDSGVRLDWTYVNKGDYDQNGEVNISDLTSLGVNLGKTTASSDWLSHARAADGDANGEVNIADITPIGANFLSTLEGYKVQTTATPSNESSWTNLANATFASSSIPAGQALRMFSYNVAAPVPGNWYRVVAYDGTDLGSGSNAVQFSLAAPVVKSVTPLTGTAQTAATFTATLSGGTPSSWSWDFGGGATPNTSTDAMPSVTLADGGSYIASVTVSNAAGSITFPFTLDIVVPPRPVIDGVRPTTGIEGQQANMTAQLSGGQPSTYSWDFGGGATPDISSDAAPLVTFGTAGNYIAHVTVGNAGGSHTFNFELQVTANQPPVASIIQNWTGNSEDVAFRLDGSGSNDYDGTVVKWEWDLDNDGVFETDNTPATPFIFTLPKPGLYVVGLRVTDNLGASSTATATLDAHLRPHPAIVATPWYGAPGTTVTLDATNSYDSDGVVTQFAWDLDGDGLTDSTDPVCTTTLPATIDSKVVTLMVTDNDGLISTDPAEHELVSLPDNWSLVPFDGGSSPFLATMGGNPALAFYVDDQIEYTRADDPLGESWGSPQKFGDPFQGHIRSLGIVGGLPALAYVETDQYRPCFARSQALDGSVWSDPLLLGTAPVRSNDLFEVDGHPATFIVSQGIAGQDSYLYYLRASDTNGANWPAVPVQAGQGAFSGWTSPALIDGHPALATGMGITNVFVDQHPVFVRSDDSGGNFWPQPVDVSPDGMADDMRAHLVIANGVPAMLWVRIYPQQPDQPEKADLAYSYALDRDGNTWTTETVLNFDTKIVGGIDLAIVNGKPVIAYIQAHSYKLDWDPNQWAIKTEGVKIMKSLDAQGTSWGGPEMVMPFSGIQCGTHTCDIVDAGGHVGIAVSATKDWSHAQGIIFYAVQD